MGLYGYMHLMNITRSYIIMTIYYNFSQINLIYNIELQEMNEYAYSGVVSQETSSTSYSQQWPLLALYQRQKLCLLATCYRFSH